MRLSEAIKILQILNPDYEVTPEMTVNQLLILADFVGRETRKKSPNKGVRNE